MIKHYIKSMMNHGLKKIIQLIDLAGHEKYLKTTVFGVTGLFPDYGFVVIGAITGITRLTKNILVFCFILKFLLSSSLPKLILLQNIFIKNWQSFKKIITK